MLPRCHREGYIILLLVFTEKEKKKENRKKGRESFPLMRGYIYIDISGKEPNQANLNQQSLRVRISSNLGNDDLPTAQPSLCRILLSSTA